VERALVDLRHVTVGDGMRVDTLRCTVLALREQVENKLGALPLNLVEMCGLLELFPGLVLPVELREESSVFLDLQKKKGVGVIGRMLRKARQIAEGGELRDYVQGLIVSMSRTVEDIEAAVATAERAVGKVEIPIIPLFERGGDLDEAPGTVDRILSRGLPVLYKNRRQPGKLEIMLGYSDTSKRMGAFASRRRIALAMHELTAVCRKHSIEPIFFHGSGGSVTRGGGSIVEQLASWPGAARQIVKLTVQGEMVERSMSTPQIFRRSVERLLTAARTLPPRLTAVKHPVLDELGARSAAAFETLVQETDFLHFMKQATPYPDLCVLHLGSRPAHRPGKDAAAAGLGSLRAIPWVLCFTQGRLLVPSWYGIGTAFAELSRRPEKLAKIKEAFDTDLAFKGFVKLMGFSLAKGDRAVFSFFVDTLTQEPALLDVKEQLLAEEQRVAHMVHTLSGEESYLWFRPWLAESILLRGSIIHSLSALEVKALRQRHSGVREEGNDELLRIAIAGTAIGMLTTG
ncbi:MAG: phosphoenolpyruvate carboxylase, partial [Candidatus Aminicenantes bacterium]|nr:phosphoenolpyruvate carboxylase [Candidatus Aminicenantes bacterium]